MIFLKLYQNCNVKEEIKDFFYLFALQGLNYIVPLLVLPYLMKTLGAEKFGYIGFSLSVCQYLMIIIDFGFNLSATKRIVCARHDRNQLNRIFSATMYAKVGLLLVAFLIMLALSFVPEFAVYHQTMFVFFVMVISNAFMYIFLFQGLGKIRVISIVNAIAKLAIFPLYFMFVRTPDDYLVAALLQVLVFAFATLANLIIVRKYDYVNYVKVSSKEVLGELKESFPIFLSLVSTNIYTVCFVVILGYYVSPSEVGNYAAVDRIMRAMCALVMTPLLQVFYPKISSLSQEMLDSGCRLLRLLLLSALLLMLMVMLVMYFGQEVIITFLGEDYSSSEILFKIMSFAPIFVGVSGVAAQLGLLAMGDSKDKKYYQNVYIIAGVFALVGMFVFIPIYLSVGAAFVLSSTEMLVCMLMLFRAKKFYLVRKS